MDADDLLQLPSTIIMPVAQQSVSDPAGGVDMTGLQAQLPIMPAFNLQAITGRVGVPITDDANAELRRDVRAVLLLNVQILELLNAQQNTLHFDKLWPLCGSTCLERVNHSHNAMFIANKQLTELFVPSNHFDKLVAVSNPDFELSRGAIVFILWLRAACQAIVEAHPSYANAPDHDATGRPKRDVLTAVQTKVPWVADALFWSLSYHGSC